MPATTAPDDLSSGAAALAQLRQWRSRARSAWRGLAPRERLLVTVAAVTLTLFAAWQLLVAPPLRTLQQAPQRMAQLDAQLQRMQQMAAEARGLQGRPTPGPEEAARALQSATSQRFGEQARLSVSGERATATLQAVPSEALWAWLTEVRSAARVRPVELQLVRREGSTFDGTVVLTLPPPR